MKRSRRVLRWFLLGLALLLLTTVIGVAIFVHTAPQFGQPPEGEALRRMEASPHYHEGEFINLIETELGSFGDMLSTLADFLFGMNLTPEDSLPVRFGQGNGGIDSLTYITWYGHSAFLFEMDGKRILIDPMLGETAAPVSFGSKRFPYQQPIPIEELTDIDLLILSHDHYDHLDYESILALKDQVKHFFTSLGVGSHLQHWGISAEQISELDWWETGEWEGIKLIACPARHFSGRGLSDRNSTQWASWVIAGAKDKIYFSGDGGYGPHFSEIGERFGPFDLALLECGQYNEAWAQIHLMPEESVQAGMDLQAELIMPIHWGSFQLSVHEWTDPIVRFSRAADSLQMPLIHPYIGERFALGLEFPREEWWLLNKEKE